jgi:hypothetical protein
MSEDEPLARAVVPTHAEIVGATEGYLRERFASTTGRVGPALRTSLLPRLMGGAIGFAIEQTERPSADRFFVSLPANDSPATTAWAALLDAPSPQRDREETATNVLFAALRVRDHIMNDWPPDLDRGEPLDSRVYTSFFGRCLVPDRGVRYAVRDSDGKHVVVFVRGKAFRVEVTHDGKVLPRAAILASLRRCVALAETETLAPGMATAGASAEFSLLYRRLCAGQVNLTSLRAISEALLVLCLDDDEPESDERLGFAAHAGAPHNRWYMHALQLVVFRNCKVAVVGSFDAGLEGQPAIRVLGQVAAAWNDFDKPISPTNASGPVMPLRWSLPPGALDDAAAHCSKAFRYSPENLLRVDFGRTSAASLGLTPGFGFHLLLQAALIDHFGRMPEGAILQLVSRRHLEDTPLATQRVESPASIAFARALLAGEQGPTLRARAQEAQAAYNLSVHETKNVCNRSDVFGTASERLLETHWRRPMRWLLRFVPEPRELFRLSLLSLRPGIRLIGRFGVHAGTPTSVWGHPLLGDDDMRLVLVPGRRAVVPPAPLRSSLQRVARLWHRG